MVIIHLCTRFDIPSFNSSLFIAIKRKVKYTLCAATMLHILDCKEVNLTKAAYSSKAHHQTKF
jgi:hypothetical protein